MNRSGPIARKVDLHSLAWVDELAGASGLPDLIRRGKLSLNQALHLHVVLFYLLEFKFSWLKVCLPNLLHEVELLVYKLLLNLLLWR